MGCNPELNTSPELEPDAVSYFQTLRNILGWIIQLERIDIITKVMLVSSHVALLKEGHLDAAVHILAMLIKDIIPDWCMILCTQKQITVLLRNVIDQSSIRMLRRLYP